jgi:hypothetical protein
MILSAAIYEYTKVRKEEKQGWAYMALVPECLGQEIERNICYIIKQKMTDI